MGNTVKQNLIIGSSSQTAQYWPRNNTVFISSRNIDFDFLKKHQWKKCYLAFGELRVYLEKPVEFYAQVNVHYTASIIEEIKNNCEKIFYFSSSDLWNLHEGAVNLQTPFKYDGQNGYIASKHMFDNKRKNRGWENVFCLYPFNYNSVHRDKKALMGKVFDSIINKKKITLGDTYSYRDYLHAKYVVREALKADGDAMIGSGRVIFVNDFIRDLYSHFKMEYLEFVEEKKGDWFRTRRGIFYADKKICDYRYSDLLKDTTDDIKTAMRKQMPVSENKVAPYRQFEHTYPLAHPVSNASVQILCNHSIT